MNQNIREILDTTVWLDAVQAAGYLRISTGTLRNMVSNGKLPFYKLGNRLRFIQSELDSMLRKNKFGPEV